MLLYRKHIKIMNYKIYLLNFSNYSNKKCSKFKLNFVDDQDFSNFMKGLDIWFYGIRNI